MKKINMSTEKKLSRVPNSIEVGEPVRTAVTSEAAVNVNQQLLLQSAPGKLLYSIRETSSVLGVSYEFVRAKIYSGRVMAKAFGSRKMIPVFEVSRLLSEGLAA